MKGLLGGFLIGLGLQLIAAEIRENKARQTWAEATNGTGKDGDSG